MCVSVSSLLFIQFSTSLFFSLISLLLPSLCSIWLTFLLLHVAKQRSGYYSLFCCCFFLSHSPFDECVFLLCSFYYKPLYALNLYNGFTFANTRNANKVNISETYWVDFSHTITRHVCFFFKRIISIEMHFLILTFI